MEAPANFARLTLRGGRDQTKYRKRSSSAKPKKSGAGIDKPMPKPICLYTRFSIIATPATQHVWIAGQINKRAAYIAEIMAEARLRIRESIFFYYTLPNIDKAAKHNPFIRHLVLASTLLPDWMKRKLAEQHYPWLSLKYVSPNEEIHWNSMIDHAIREMKLPTGEHHVAVARLDDDDILAPIYFKSMERYIKSQFHQFCVSHSSGYYAYWDQDKNAFTRFAPAFIPMTSQGLAIITKFDGGEGRVTSRFSFPPGAHTKIDRKVPTILDARHPCFIRTLHSTNDVYCGKDDDRELEKRLRRELVDHAPIRAVFLGFEGGSQLPFNQDG
jgi:hypothetical protein